MSITRMLDLNIGNTSNASKLLQPPAPPPRHAPEMRALPGGHERQERRREPHPRPQTREPEPHHSRPPLLPPLLRHGVLSPHHPQPPVEHDQLQVSVVASRKAVAAVVQQRRVRPAVGVCRGILLPSSSPRGQGLGAIPKIKIKNKPASQVVRDFFYFVPCFFVILV